MMSTCDFSNWLHALETEFAQVEFVDEHIHDADWIIDAKLIVEMLREKHALLAILTFDKTFHFIPMRY